MDLKKCWGVEKCLGGMPTNFVYRFEKKILRGGGVMPKYFMDLKKNVGGGGGGVYAKIFYGLEKMLGGGVMPKYFMDLKKCCGVENVCVWI